MKKNNKYKMNNSIICGKLIDARLQKSVDKIIDKYSKVEFAGIREVDRSFGIRKAN